jgi:hypothetical protein
VNAPLLQSVAGIAALVAALGSASAWAEIYKWVDEKGGTVYSNVQPTRTRNVKNLEVVVEDEKTPESASASAAATRREQELLDRISRLERQLEAQAYQAPPPPPAPQYYSGSYYPSSYYPSSYYPSTYYPAYYPYAVLPGRFVVPTRTFVSPRFVSGRVSSFHTGTGRGRP